MDRTVLGELNNIIIPQRYIPFDLGMSINEKCAENIKHYFKEKGYHISDIPGLLHSLSIDISLMIDISTNARLYIYAYGIGVFVLEDDLYHMDSRYAPDYCQTRREAHREILEFRHGELSSLIENIIDDLRRIVKDKNGVTRPSASKTWEHKGLSYVMTVSYIIQKEMPNYQKLPDLEKKNLQIMLQPSMAQKEDTIALHDLSIIENNEFDPYDFDINELDEPKDWMKAKGCAIYISWAAVVVCMCGCPIKYMEILECLEVDLQAMWFFTYCLHLNFESLSSSKKLTSGFMKREKYNFQRKYNEFISTTDSSMSAYINTIRNELIETSNIEKEKSNFVEYINFCIDEAESRENEKQTKYSLINEILLFIIAFIQIAPMLYSLLLGELTGIKIWPIIIMLVLVVIAIVIIVKKDL